MTCGTLPFVDVEAFNDRLAREHPIDAYYADAPRVLRYIEQRRLAIIREMVGPAAQLQIAEIGSGGGHVLRMFREARITAIDVSEVFLATARKNLAGYDACFIKGEVDKLDLQEKSYDRIICTEVLEHTEDPDAILASIARLLRPDGIAVITIPNDPLILALKGLVRRTPARLLLQGKINWGGDEFHLHQWTPGQFKRVLAKRFRILRTQAAPFDLFPVRACFQCVLP